MFRLVVAILLIGLNSCNSGEREKESMLKDTDLQKVRLFDLSGDSVDLNKYQGKTVFINFWATWCKPCLQEIPSIAKAQELLKNNNIIFLFASDETVEQIEQFKRTHDFNFNFLRIDNAPELNIMGLPTTFIYNPDGKLIFSEMGFRKWDEKQNSDLILNAKNLQ